MSERRPPELDELVGEGLPEEELAALRRVDALLRAVPAPPELPDRLAAPARDAPPPVPVWTRRRTLAAVALAAALSALFFGLGTRVGGGDGFAERAAVPMEATDAAQGASAVLRVGEQDADGNRAVRLEARGLEPLPAGGYYVLWLEEDGEFVGTCGTFSIADGRTTAEWTVSYDLAEYDAWVVSRHLPGDEPADWARVLEAEIRLQG